MLIINGRKIAAGIIHNLKSEVAALPFQPVFCDILVGRNPVSAQYVNVKAKKAESIGVRFLRAEFADEIGTENLVREIKKINQTPNLCGLIVQLPLPSGIDRRQVLDAIDPKLDVDCIGRQRSAAFYGGDLEIVPPTAAAVVKILDALQLDLTSKHILVVGQGELVGRPVAFLLQHRLAAAGTPSSRINIADIHTKNTSELMKDADIIISATGRPKLITGEKIKPGAIIIDAGVAEDGGLIVGDVDFESVKNVAGAVSPVPGGVGPVTVAMLLNNVVKVAKYEQE